MRNAIATCALTSYSSNLTTLLSTCGHAGNLRVGSSLHATIIKHTTLFQPTEHRNVLVVYNSLIAMYSRCGDLTSAVKVFHLMPHRDTVSWNSMLSAHFHNQGLVSGLRFFRDDVFPRCDHATLTTVLAACVGPELICIVGMMQKVVVLCGHALEISVGNALVTAYFRCGCGVSARKVFDEMPKRNVVTWTAMVSGLQQSELYTESLGFFRNMWSYVPANSLTYSSSLLACAGTRGFKEGRQIHALAVKAGVDRESCVESAVMVMYSKCGAVDDACSVFETSEEPDKVSHTVILAGYAQNGMEEKAFSFFVKMMRKGIEIDADIISAVLRAFGGCAPLSLGRQLHSLVIKTRFGGNPFVANGLINMYSRCGDLPCSMSVFDEMSQRNSVTWNSMIAAFARHGLGSEALRLYEYMRSEGMVPTDVTFLSLLHACSHAGAVDKGMEYLKSMHEAFGISPRIEHYACVIDMFGRAARLDEAKAFIESLPVRPNALIWQSLLGACGIYGNLEVGRYAAERLLGVEPESAAAYVLLANICSSQGAWKEKAGIIGKMREVGVRKDIGMSWIEVAGEVHRFAVGDEEHLQAKAIHEILRELSDHSRAEECGHLEST